MVTIGNRTSISITIFVWAAVAVAGCHQPDVGTEEPPNDPIGPPIELFGGDAGSGDAGDVPLADAGMNLCAPTKMLEFTVLTSPPGGKYAPKNIGAIWVERADGTFVHTLEMWARTRRRYLVQFRSRTGSNTVDAVTGATLTSHRTHSVRWNLTDVAGCAVSPGDYKLVLELTDRDGSGPLFEIPFTYDGGDLDLVPEDQRTFTAMHLTIADP
ncbi:MAG: DUF2271 domain-containing protein [Polyangiales bacterium]